MNIKNYIKIFFLSLNPLKAKQLSSQPLFKVFIVLIVLIVLFNAFRATTFFHHTYKLFNQSNFSLTIKLNDFNYFFLNPLNHSKKVSKKAYIRRNDLLFTLNKTNLFIKRPFCIINCQEELPLNNINYNENKQIFYDFLIIFSFGYFLLFSLFDILKIVIFSFFISTIIYFVIKVLIKRWVRFKKLFIISLSFSTLLIIGEIINLYFNLRGFHYLLYFVYLALGVKELFSKKNKETISGNKIKSNLKPKHSKRSKSLNKSGDDFVNITKEYN